MRLFQLWIDIRNFQLLCDTVNLYAILLPFSRFYWNRVLVVAKNIFNMAAIRYLHYKIYLVTWLIKFQICCCVPDFINIGWLFVEIWRFYDLQYGSRLPSWIFKIEMLFIAMLFCFPVQNFIDIGLSGAELWPKTRFLKQRPSAILNFRGPIMGCLRSQRSTVLPIGHQ